MSHVFRSPGSSTKSSSSTTTSASSRAPWTLNDPRHLKNLRVSAENFGTIPRMFFNLPTLLTWARIVAIPLIVGIFYLDLSDATRNLIATVLFVVVALTDWADGYLARKLNQTSSFG